jgi:hypothetical protein
MTRTLTVPAGERGVVRLFAVDLPEEDARAFAADPRAVGRALGAPDIDPARIDVFPVSRVAPLGLPLFLSEGHGIAPSDIAPHVETLDALDGHVALVASGAFGDAARSVVVAPPLRLVGTFREERTPIAFGTLPDAQAREAPPQPDPPTETLPPGPGRRGRRTKRGLALVVLVVVILGFILLKGGR